jgi:hypothetical protein
MKEKKAAFGSLGIRVSTITYYTMSLYLFNFNSI